jgi:superfamily II DNA/RNA helicase
VAALHVRGHPAADEVVCFDAMTGVPFVSRAQQPRPSLLTIRTPVPHTTSAAHAARRPSAGATPSSPQAATPVTPATFASLGVSPALVAALAAGGITDPFPIQTATLPDSLTGRDVLGRGRTGSGKTVAFALPLVAALAGTRSRPRGPRGLVLVPTRELAVQVDATIAPLAAAVGLRTRTIFGGVTQNPQVTALAAGVDIIVATPGRLADLINQGHASLGSIEVTVIDEADHMADLGFLPEVRRLLDRTPAEGQRLLFSATLDSGVDVLARRYLHDPVTHEVDSADSHVPAMDHHVFTVETAERGRIVEELLGGHGRALAFARTKHQAKRWARILSASGIAAVDLHGNLSQAARQRNLAAFADGDVRVLVATDIAARGIHVDDITLVVHIDPPAEHKAYLHRSGRTARAGAAGVVVTVATTEQGRDVADLMRRAAITPTRRRVRVGDPAITELVGPSAPRVVVADDRPIPAERTGRGSGSGRGSSGGRSGAGSRSGSGRGSAGSSRGQSSGQSRSARPTASSSARPVSSASTQVWSSGGPPASPATPRRGPRRATRPAGTAGPSS